MLLPTFTYLEPRTVEEACAMLAAHRPGGARVLAGGTDILVDLKARIFARDQRLKDVRCLVSLCRIPGLRSIDVRNETVSIGALVSMTEMAEHPLVASRLQAYAEGAMEVGSPLVRNRGTIGGNIANSRPAADTIGPLVALEGTVVAAGPKGERRIPAEKFFTGPGANVLQPEEIVRAVEFPLPPRGAGSAYVKLGVRRALDISIAGVAAAIRLNDSGIVSRARICMTSVGPAPILSAAAARLLEGKPLTKELLAAAAEAAKNDARPIDDARGSAWYRREMCRTLTRRMLERAHQRAMEELNA